MTDRPLVERGSTPGTYTFRGWAIVQCSRWPVDADSPHVVCPIGRSTKERAVLSSLAAAVAYVLRMQDGADVVATCRAPADVERRAYGT